MKKMFFLILLNLNLFGFSQNKESANNTSSQTQLTYSFGGIIASGYVDHGAYLNFTGPGLNFSYSKSQILIGMLPSLRFKKDTGTIKNSIVMPSLGFGITYTFKYLAFQVPIYYTNKTSTTNGHWNLGVGLGLKLGAIRLKKAS